jgi:hypothetical protein
MRSVTPIAFLVFFALLVGGHSPLIAGDQPAVVASKPNYEPTHGVDVFSSERHYRPFIGNILRDILGRLAPPMDFTFNKEENASELYVELFNSRIGEHGEIFKGCFWDARNRKIACDLALVDEIIDNYQMVELFGKTRNQNRKHLLRWILSHEIGHLVLQHRGGYFSQPRQGFQVFNAPNQQEELAADAFSVCLIGESDKSIDDYSYALDFSNALIRKSLCPTTFPQACGAIPIGGVGLHYDYVSGRPIKIDLSGSHPEFVARFLRILYISAYSDKPNLLTELAKRAIGTLTVQVAQETARPLDRLLSFSEIDFRSCLKR